MAQPTDVTVFGKEVYESVEPLSYADEQEAWALLRYMDALVNKGQQAATYGRDTGKIPGWGILMDPNKSPAETLEWLSQLAGVDLGLLKRAFIVEQSNLLYVPNFSHTAKEGAPAHWKSGSEETANEIFKMKEVWEVGKPALEIQTGALALGKAAWAQAVGSVTLPLAAEELFVVTEKENYSITCNSKIISETGKIEIYLELEFFNINGESISKFKDAFAKGVGVHLFKRVTTAPAGAAAARWRFKLQSAEAATKANVLITECMLEPSPTNEILSYGDGDFAGWTWEGATGNSPSSKLSLQSEEQYIASQRKYILSLPSSNRGTIKDIEEASRQYLIGNKTVFLKQRDGGAYRLTVVTYILETPSEAQVKQTLDEHVPGGIILTYSVVPGAAYIIIRTAYSTYKKLWETEFLTYNGLRNNLPGT